MHFFFFFFWDCFHPSLGDMYVGLFAQFHRRWNEARPVNIMAFNQILRALESDVREGAVKLSDPASVSISVS
jgi:hypothetical protein